MPIIPFIPLRPDPVRTNVESVTYNALYQRLERISSVFTTTACFPKLDAGGSSPLSRSIVSITYKESDFPIEPTFRGNEVSDPPKPINRKLIGSHFND